MLEKYGEGLNLTEEVRDGIWCHTNQVAKTLEGRVVRIADRIAYINHDIEDAIRARVLDNNDIPQHITKVLGSCRSHRINTLVTAVIEDSSNANDIVITGEKADCFNELHEFMFERVYRNSVAKGQEGKAIDLVKQLYRYFVKNPDCLGDEYKNILQQEGTERAVCDYIAGMTDRYAISVYQDLFVPYAWK